MGALAEFGILHRKTQAEKALIVIIANLGGGAGKVPPHD